MRAWAAGALMAAALVGLLLGAGVVFAAEDADPGDASPEPSPSEIAKMRKEAARARVRKQLALVREKLASLREAEAKLSMEVLQLQAKAAEGLKDPGKAQKNIQEGKINKALERYRQIYAACAKRLAKTDVQYLRLEAFLRPIDRELERLEEPRFEAAVADLRDSIWRSRRANMQRVADIYKSIAAYNLAMGVYVEIYKALPKDKRDEKELEVLKNTIMELKKKHEKMVEKQKERRQKANKKGNAEKYRGNN